MSKASFFDFDAEYGNRYEVTIRKILPSYDNLYVAMTALLQNLLDEKAHVLIVGAGGGKELLTFGGSNPKWNFTGVDLSDQMMRYAKRKIAGSDIENRTSLYVGGLEELEETHLYDGATCILVMPFVPDDGAKESLLANIASRLKQGAPLLLVGAHGDPQSEEFQIYFQALRRKLTLLSSMSNQESESIMSGALNEMHFSTKERMKELMTLTGFSNQHHFFADLMFDGWLAIRS
ncbi:class I SAM-dependent methyltransferase [Paenibacillus roseipurpureus]|uniref:Class I SAM-dependent methyltransferase n=1 Tax=Paenibacillus roseopurpureus TaxID=2918901 RepID=A0AA96LP44_9BACL|nr:class I SAM-dependent methyltransferase [Paenibacillus sp. MBLB1832]WNR45632.1 class I SAM-dependent methyltransferase [Paenibacillus sp. MBLB1832]